VLHVRQNYIYSLYEVMVKQFQLNMEEV